MAVPSFGRYYYLNFYNGKQLQLLDFYKFANLIWINAGLAVISTVYNTKY